jgi:iron complex transport system substrate-binding protein
MGVLRQLGRAVAGLLVAGLLAGEAAAEGVARRVVSMNPSLTRIVVALGARDVLVGVDEVSARAEPAVAALPRVGGLYSPSLEAVAALRPDLVVLVPSAEQREFRARLEALGVEVLGLAPDPVGFDDVLAAIETLGRRVGREDAARARGDAIRRTRDAVRRATAGRPRPRAVFVLQREPLFVVGRGSFLDEMLGLAGAENLGAALGEPWPRASLEWLVAQAPDVLLDSDDDARPAADHWRRWPSLPAVTHERVVAVDEGAVTLPGPDLDEALLQLVRALHGDALVVEVEGAR